METDFGILSAHDAELMPGVAFGIINMADKKTKLGEVPNYKSSKEVFDELYAVDVSKYTEEKNGLTYLPWADAMMEVTKRFPDWEYDVLWFDGKPFLYDDDLGYIVWTAVTIEGKTKIMWLPVLDFHNKTIKKGNCTWYEINKSLMRCVVKNLAAFGLGINIYKKDSLPEPVQEENDRAAAELAEARNRVTEAGTAAMKRKVKKEQLYEVLEKFNNGDRSTGTIKDVETCEKIIAALSELKAATKKGE